MSGACSTWPIQKVDCGGNGAGLFEAPVGASRPVFFMGAKGLVRGAGRCGPCAACDRGSRKTFGRGCRARLTPTGLSLKRTIFQDSQLEAGLRPASAERAACCLSDSGQGCREVTPCGSPSTTGCRYRGGMPPLGAGPAIVLQGSRRWGRRCRSAPPRGVKRAAC